MRLHPSHQHSVAKLARQAIMAHTAPTDLVIDPICGSGDILVEAVKADRMAIGAEYEPYWVDMARTRLERTTDSGLGGFGAVAQVTIDTLVSLLKTDCEGKVPLVLTAPQTGTTTCPSESDTAADIDEFVDSVVFAAARCTALLTPDGVIGVISWPARQTDIAGRLTEGLIDAGFALASRCMPKDTSVSLTLFNLPHTR